MPTNLSFRKPVLMIAMLTVIVSAAQAGELRNVLWNKAEANSSLGDPCQGKDRCVIVFVAPWCGYCRVSEPFIKALRADAESSSRYGLKIVIGGDRPDALQTKARELAENTFIDPDGTVMKAAGLSGYPSWISTDGDGNILRRWGGAQTDASPAAQQQLLARLDIQR